MKFSILLVALFTILSVSASAKKVPLSPSVLTKNADGNWTYEKVVDVPGKPKAEIYKEVKTWILANLKSADNVTTLDDVNFDIIATTPTLIIDAMKNSVYQNQRINFKVAVQFKDGKIRLQLNAFVYFANYYNSTLTFIPVEGGFDSLEIPQSIAEDTNAKIDKLVLGLVASLESAAKTGANSNW